MKILLMKRVKMLRKLPNHIDPSTSSKETRSKLASEHRRGLVMLKCMHPRQEINLIKVRKRKPSVKETRIWIIHQVLTLRVSWKV